MVFDKTTVLRLDVETTPVGLVNLVQNPSGELGGWGWVTPVANTVMGGNGTNLTYTSNATGAQSFKTEPMAVAAGQYVSARWNFTSAVPAAGQALWYRVRVNWLNASKAVLSSSTFSAYNATNTPHVGTYGAVQAPASTVYAELKYALYKTNTGTAITATPNTMVLRQATVVKSATGASFNRKNLASNPSFETNTTGWSSSASATATLARVSTVAQVGTWSMRLTRDAAGLPSNTMGASADFSLNGGADGAGQTFTGSAYFRADAVPRTIAASLRFVTSGGGLSSPVTVTSTDTTSGWTRLDVTATVPAGGYIAGRLYLSFVGTGPSEVHYIDAVMVEEVSIVGTYFDGATPDAGGIDYAWTGTAHASVSTATQTNADFGYIEPATYIDVLGPTHTISAKRDEMNVGTLTADILDATLDPSQFNLIRPGKRCRLMALDNATSTWTPIFTGKVSRGETAYDPTRTDVKAARITLTALDAASALSQVSRKSGVATIPELPYVLEGAGVPWSVNGSGNQVGSATVVTTSDNASALDQIAITRDSVIGYAWVDRRGVTNVWDRASIGTTVIATLNESVYSDLDLDYDTDRCINSVTVKLRRINAANGQTVEVTYGPYVDQPSIDQWGPHSAEFTVQGITDSGAAASAYAAPILTANATPAIRINSVSLPIRSASDVVTGKALLDLYDMVTVANTNAGISTNMRVTGIEHKISPDSWTMSLDFTVSGSVASPTQTPDLSNPAAAGVQQFGGATDGGTGPWGAGTPGPTSGRAITLPAGVLRAQVSVTAFSANGTTTDAWVQVYFDGVSVGDCVLPVVIPTNQRVALAPTVFTVTVTAGTHYWALKQISGSSAATDRALFFGVVSPS